MRMVLVLMIVTGIWGGLLSLVKMATEDQIQYQRIKNIKAPALKKALTVEYDNDPIKDRKTIVIGTDKKGRPIERPIFLAKQGDKVVAVGLEAYGVGYDGDIGVMLTIEVDKDKLGGIAVTTHTETPGVGTVVFDDQEFMNQFASSPLSSNFSGNADTVSGATYTANGVIRAVQKGVEIYNKHKPEIL
ncbi:MAG: FMN-binding protein [Thermodesulfobacteriota bacterium]